MEGATVARRRRTIVAGVVAGIVIGSVVTTAATSRAAGDPVEVEVAPSRRRIQLVDPTTGAFSEQVAFASASAIPRGSGGGAPTCSEDVPAGTRLPDGRVLDDDTRVTSRLVYREVHPAAFWSGVRDSHPDRPVVPEPDAEPAPVAFAEVWRSVVEFCAFDFAGPVEPFYRRVILVPPTDPVFGIDTRFDLILDSMAGIVPASSTVVDPIAAEWGGLVTRAPAWFAIASDTWRTVRSNPVLHRGWELHLEAIPIGLSFDLVYDDRDTTTIGDAAGRLRCVPDAAPVDDGTSMPARPDLAALALPGVNGPCTWTPHGPGSVSSTPVVTYRIVRHARWRGVHAAEEWRARSPFDRRGITTTITTGEIRSVNVVP